MKTPTRSTSTLEDTFARQLAAPVPTSTDRHGHAQSLTKGAAGIALLHIERAHTGAGRWQTAHSWVRAAAGEGISAADDTGLHFGAPALSFVLHAAQADGVWRYKTALPDIDSHVTALAHRRIERAYARIDCGDLPSFAEYDLLHGLTGIGAHLLHHTPGNDALGRILAYLVRLTEPLRVDGQTLPGWWTFHGPHLSQSDGFYGGHANLGIAHGISGPLALLAQAQRHGVSVDGHAEAIHAICTWMDTWRQDGGSGAWWPQWVTRDHLRTSRPGQRGPMRPSWCYGTPGLARAQQLAAIAIGDTVRQDMAEQALTDCLDDPVQLGRLSDAGLCHGWAGLFQTAWRAAHDAGTPEISARLPHLAEHLTRHCTARQGESSGLLEGNAGSALALRTATRTAPPTSGWDAFLLIN